MRVWTRSLLLFGTLCSPSPSAFSLDLWSVLPPSEKLVQEHGHEEQDAEHEDYPGAWPPGQRQAVAQGRDDEDAEHGADYGPRSAVDACSPKDHGGDHVEFEPQAGVAARRVDPRGVDHRGHAYQETYARVEGQLHPAYGHPGEMSRLLVVADGVDVATETGARQDQPDHRHGHDKDEQLDRHHVQQVGLADVGEPVGEIRDRLGLRQAIRQTLKQSEGAQGNDQGMQVQQGDEEAVEETRSQAHQEAEHDRQRQGQAGGVGEPDGDRDQGQVRPDREVYAPGDDYQGHPQRHEPHLDEEARGVEQVAHSEEERREEGHYYHQHDQHREQHHLAGEPQTPENRRRRAHALSPTRRRRRTSVATASKMRLPNTASCQILGTPSRIRPLRITPMRTAPVRAARAEPRPPEMLVPPITTAATT